MTEQTGRWRRGKRKNEEQAVGSKYKSQREETPAQTISLRSVLNPFIMKEKDGTTRKGEGREEGKKKSSK